jgi:hypothetical protein
MRLREDLRSEHAIHFLAKKPISLAKPNIIFEVIAEMALQDRSMLHCELIWADRWVASINHVLMLAIKRHGCASKQVAAKCTGDSATTGICER